MTLKLKSTKNQLWKGLKLAWYHNFTRIACSKKLKGLRQKTGCSSCAKWTISFEVSGCRTKTHLLHRDFIFELIWTPYFVVFKMHHSKPHHQFSTLSNFICYFSSICWFYSTKWPWNSKALQMNSKKVESWHGITISPT